MVLVGRWSSCLVDCGGMKLSSSKVTGPYISVEIYCSLGHMALNVCAMLLIFLMHRGADAVGC